MKYFHLILLIIWMLGASAWADNAPVAVLGIGAPAIPAGLPPTGAAGGDLTGSYPNPTVTAARFASPGAIGGTSANTGAFTTLSASGVLSDTSATDSTTNLTGAIQQNTGTAATSVGIGQGKINAGGVITGSSLRATGSIAMGTGNSGSNALNLNSGTGSTSTIQYAINNANISAMQGTATTWVWFDNVNSYNIIGFTYAPAASAQINFGPTLDASAVGTAAISDPGGLSVSKSIFTGGDIVIAVAGKQLKIKEGTNAAMGSSVLVGGTVVVSNTLVTANTRIFLTSQVDGGSPGFLRVSTRTAGTSFTILSSSGTDTSTVAWRLIEPAP